MNDPSTAPTEQDDTPEEREQPDTASPAATGLFVLTNRFNLLVMLGSQLIGPMESYRKYYEDLLVLTAGAIPVLRCTPSQELLDQVSSQSPQAFPVLIELSSLDGIPILSEGEQVLLTGPLPWTKVSRVHFASDRHAREHLSRPYANIFDHEDLVAVSPALFSGASGCSFDDFKSVQASGTASASDWNQFDRYRGALNGLVAGAESRVGLARAERTLSDQGPARGDAAPWLSPTFLAVDPSSRKEPAKKTAATSIFAAVMGVLIGADVQDEWRPRAVLEAVAAEVMETKLSKAEKDSAHKNLQTVRAIVAGEREFRPFRPESSGLVPAKALLLLLLREDLDSLLEWPVSETGADEETIQTAATYAGALRGLSRQPCALRHPALDALTAISTTNALGGSIPAPPIAVETNGSETLLRVNDNVVKTVQASPDNIYRGIPERARAEARVETAVAVGWLDLVRSTVEFAGPVTAEPTSEQTVVIRGRAVRIDQEVDEEEFVSRLKSSDPKLVIETLSALARD